MDFLKNLEAEFLLIPNRGYTQYIKTENVKNFLDYFNKVSIYYTLPAFILTNENLMK